MPLLSAAMHRRGGSLLDALPEPRPENEQGDDAVLRHEKARAERAQRPDRPQGAPMVQPAEAESAPLPQEEAFAGPFAESRPRARGSFGRIVGLTVAGALAGSVVAFAWPKTFVATSEMLIAPGEAALVDNQLRVLRSGTMLTAVADRLNLAADAEFSGAGGALSSLGEIVAGDGDVAEQRRRQAVDTLAKSVDVSRQGASSAVTVSASSADPRKAALIANTITELFVESAGREPGASTQRLAELREAVAQADNAIELFKAENELVDTQGRLITDDEIVRLGEQLSNARARTVELNARAASTREANVDSIVTGSLPEQHSVPALAVLRARHAAARQQVDRLSARLGPRHPERLAAEAELDGAREEIAAELRRVASSLQTELRRAVEQEQEFASQLARMKVRQGDIGEDMVRLRELENDARLKRSAYERAMQAMQAGGGAAGAASIISRAEPPLGASAPSAPAFSLAGGLAGLLAGLGLAGWSRRRGETEPAVETQTVDGRAPEDWAPADAAQNETGKEADAMYPYSPYGQPYAPQQAIPAAPQQAQPQPQPQPQPAMQYAPVQQPQYPDPQQMAPMQPPMASQPGWPGVPYPAPPMPAAHWQPPQPMMQVPFDPWAQYRQPAPPPYPAQAYAPQPPAVVYYVPVAQPQVQAAPQPAPSQRIVEDRRDSRDAFIDRSADAAIEEIRQSLREFRDAIEDFADERHRRAEKRFGT